MKRTILIASAAPVEQELAAEFGFLPPAFLPLANRRLFTHQRKAIGDVEARILLSLPETFTPDPVDARHLAELGIETVMVPAGLSLGQSLVYVINVTATAGGPITILHGDTLLPGLDVASDDVVSISTDVPPGYRWGHVHLNDDTVHIDADREGDGMPGESIAVLSGFFALRDSALLVQSITRRGGDFLAGLRDYADRRPLRPAMGSEWFDFGHASTYYASRRRMSTAREFNRLVATRRASVKSSDNVAKIEAEAKWFESLPAPMRIHTPAYLGLRRDNGDLVYALDYLNHPTLADLFVFGRLPPAAWERIFEACDEFLGSCAGYAATEPVDTDGLYREKTLARLETFAKQAGISLEEPCRLDGAWLPSLARMAELASAMVPPAEADHVTLLHGDFCFSNILYDNRGRIVRVIDPRGLDNAGQFTIFGDRRYDLAKLYHSAVGLYDVIVAGRYRLKRRSGLELSFDIELGLAQRTARDVFLKRSFGGLTHASASAHPAAVLLFLSMLPLHKDDPSRQFALLANAMRLFLDLDRNP